MGWSYTVSELARMTGGEVAGRGDVSFCRVSTDTRTLERGDVFFALSGENFDGNRFVEEAFAKGAAAVVTHTAHEAGPCAIVDDSLQALQRFAQGHREQFEIPVIAITGSCGKTSSKDLIAAVLQTRYTVVKTKGNLNNEIGLPLSLLEIDAGTEAVVVEMGANHLGEIAQLCTIAKPTEAAITMIAEAHLEGFGSLEGVARAKGEIVGGLPESGVFYLNVDDPCCVKISEGFGGRIVSFGTDADVALESCAFNEAGEMDLRVRPVGELVLPLHARAHAANALLAIAVGLQHGVVSFEEPLRRACLESTRFKVFTAGPLEIIDDTYNANPASLRVALEALRDRPVSGSRMAALGEMGELGERTEAFHEAAGILAAECGVEHLFVRGPHAKLTLKGARSGGLEDVQVIDNHKDMADAIAQCAGPGDALLVKGSRSMTMEKVIESLQEFYDAPERTGAASERAQGM